MSECAVEGCTRPLSKKLLATRVTVSDSFLDLCEYHAVGHQRRFKKRAPHGMKLFAVAVPTGEAWLVRSTSKLRAKKLVASRLSYSCRKGGLDKGSYLHASDLKDAVLGHDVRVCAVNPDNANMGVLMAGSMV